MDQKLDGTDFSQYFRDIKAESDTSLLLKQAHLSIFCEVKDWSCEKNKAKCDFMDFGRETTEKTGSFIQCTLKFNSKVCCSYPGVDRKDLEEKLKRTSLKEVVRPKKENLNFQFFFLRFPSYRRL